MNDQEKLNYINSYHLHAKVQVKIGSLEGTREKPSYKELIANPILRYSGVFEHNDLYVTCQIFADNQSLCMPVKTSYKYIEKNWSWDEWLTLPLSISDLPRNSLLTITAWDLQTAQQDVPVAGTTVSLFDNYGELRQGTYEVRMWPNKAGDGNAMTNTPGIMSDTIENDSLSIESAFNSHYPILDELDRLAKLSKMYNDGHMIKQEWLDKLTLRELQSVVQQEKKSSDFFYMRIEFPEVKCEDRRYHVIYFEENARKLTHLRPTNDIFILNDPEIDANNIIEEKHAKLEHSNQNFEINLKPDAEKRLLLNRILAEPVTKELKKEDKNLLYKYRYYLTQNKKALTKVLQCFNLNFVFEDNNIMQLLSKWQPMDVEDALELLGSKYKVSSKIRSYAVSRLQIASDNDIVLYLLQLVQALRYENFSKNNNFENRAQSDPTLAANKQMEMFNLKLKDYLIERAKMNEAVGIYLYWYLKVEISDKSDESDASNFHIFFDELKKALYNGNAYSKQIYESIMKQEGFLKNLNEVAKTVQREGGKRDAKVAKLRQALQDSPKSLLNFEEMPLILDPNVKIVGINPEQSTVFKSNLMPFKFSFRTSHGLEYATIYKIGDDLRQDQLVVQLIALMDKLLKQENLDLRLTTYKVLATGPKEGLIQFIDAMPISNILTSEYKSIKEYLRKYNASDSDRHGIKPDCMDSYVRSCAGYMVITYILGIGDRHYDNILLTRDGRMFHIDFGYILGREPKPFQPVVKWSKEMADGMGGKVGPDGKENKEYEDFKKYCRHAYLHLRRHASLIINLFSLMVDSNIPDIALEPDKTVKKIMDRFKLDMTEEQAMESLVREIESNYGSIVGNITDLIHGYSTAEK